VLTIVSIVGATTAFFRGIRRIVSKRFKTSDRLFNV
jgi:hypothetical protein